MSIPRNGLSGQLQYLLAFSLSLFFSSFQNMPPRVKDSAKMITISRFPGVFLVLPEVGKGFRNVLFSRH